MSILTSMIIYPRGYLIIANITFEGIALEHKHGGWKAANGPAVSPPPTHGGINIPILGIDTSDASAGLLIPHTPLPLIQPIKYLTFINPIQSQRFVGKQHKHSPHSILRSGTLLVAPA